LSANAHHLNVDLPPIFKQNPINMNSTIDSEYIPERSARSGLEGLDADQRGADEQPTNVDYVVEDRETAKSEETGKVNRRSSSSSATSVHVH